MATKERLISADLLVQDINADPYRTESEKSYDRCLVHRQPTVDAVPVDEIKLHRILIDNEGVPEVKLQIGDRYFIIRTDPVNAVLLPSKVRADVWLIQWWNYCRFEKLTRPMQRTVLHYEIRTDGVYAHFHDGCIHTKYFGETVFLTHEEAKTAIAKMDGEKK